MKITTDEILAVEPSAEIRCAEREFDYVDIVDFSTKPDISPDSRVLWCVTKSTTAEDLPWYGARFDRSTKVGEVSSQHRDWVVFTESGQVAGLTSNRCILVPDVGNFLKLLHRHVISVVAPIVLGVTGSVGKTTCVALLEDIFSRYGKTLRVYAKRITPLSLFEIVINQLERDHRYIVMAYAMFHQWHIAELTALLEPTVGVMLNISTEHLGIDGLRNTRDIFMSKKSLLERARFPFVEKEVAHRFKECLQQGISVFDWRDFVAPHGFNIEPFVRSRLQYTQIGAVLSAKRSLIGEVTPADIAAINKFEPKENRLRKIRCRRHQVFFDGEVTAPARLNALGATMYSPQVLAVHAVADHDEYYNQDMTLQADCLRSALQQFDSVYMSRTVDEQFRLFVKILCIRCRIGGAIRRPNPKYSGCDAVRPLGSLLANT
ncbi:MAG: Mur ligase family protein [Pseudonocardiaceae bacterium]